jgi:membrane protein implicated in regulation of membrane protease activity
MLGRPWRWKTCTGKNRVHTRQDFAIDDGKAELGRWVRVLAWWIWLIIAFAVGIIELATVTFVLLWIAIAAFVTTPLSLVVHSLWVQLLIFAVISVGLYLATRPMARRWKDKRRYPSTRLEALAGEMATVVKGAAPGKMATIRVHGELWSAESDVVLQPGQEVRITRAESSVLFVRPVPPRNAGGSPMGDAPGPRGVSAGET